MNQVWTVMRLGHDGDELQGLYASMDVVRAHFAAPIQWQDITYQGHVEWKGTVPGQLDPEYRAEPLTVLTA